MVHSDNELRLKFGSLKNELYDYKFELDEAFFGSLDQDLIKDGNVNVLLQVDKAERHFTLHFVIKGFVKKMCDVCLSELEYPIDTTHDLLVKMTDKPIDEDADIISVGSKEYELLLNSHVLDYIVLSLPMRVECKNALNRNTCDEGVTKYLNREISDEQNRENVHPEMQKLKDLFNKN
ncbi:MAG: hypothetical protein ACI8ZN_000904 [Bacteroidia bacterium]|jgi:uncharacterized protein